MRTFLRRAAALALGVVALGVPVNDLLGFALLVALGLLVGVGNVSGRPTRWLAAAGVAALALAAQALLPVPRIEEGHNVFVTIGEGEPLQQGLPPGVFAFMRDAFDAAYPASRRCDRKAAGCWLQDGVPKEAFALSADATLQAPKYSRIVGDIGFDGPDWLRLGAANEHQYNWFWSSDATRDPIPYFVMYELPRAVTGSRLCWRGTVLWEGDGERFEPLAHDAPACRAIVEADAGRRVVGVAIGPTAALSMHLERTWPLRLADLARQAARVLGLLGVGLLLVRIGSWRTLLVPGGLMLLAAGVAAFTDIRLFGGFRVLEGGMDGLMHEGYAREMLAALLRGDIAGALRGGEPLFFFMPGLRYFRLVELLAFGDTNFGYLWVILLWPVVLHRLVRQFFPPAWALTVVVGFTLWPTDPHSFSGLHAMARLAAEGFPEPLGYAAFVLALGLFCTAAAQPEGGAWRGFAAGLALSAAVATRPNLAVGALLFAAPMCLILWRRGRVRDALAPAAGGAFVLLVPLHNWIYGGRLVLASTQAARRSTMPTQPEDYGHAAAELLRGELHGPALTSVANQLAAWAAPAQLLFFAGLVGVVFACRRMDIRLRLIAIAMLGQHAVLWFWQPAERFAALTWLLTVLVLLAAFHDSLLPRLRQRLARPAHASLARPDPLHR